MARAITRVVDALARIRRRVIPARFAALELATGGWVAQALAAFCELELPQALADEPCTAADLASRGYGDAVMLSRLLRALAAYDVVRYAAGERYELGRLGEALVGAESLAPMVRYANASWHVAPYTQLAAGIRQGQSGFVRAHGMPMFAYYGQHPNASQLFDAAMQSMTGLFAQPFAQAYDFRSIRTVADLGGGTGLLVATILTQFPHLRGVLVERADAADRARTFLRLQALEERVIVLSGDIFTEALPPADAYILSHVLHDFDDQTCIQLLRNVRATLGAGRLLVYEMVAAASGNAWSADRVSDLEMLAMLPGRERTADEYCELFQRSGLHLERLIATAAPESILEVRAR